MIRERLMTAIWYLLDQNPGLGFGRALVKATGVMIASDLSDMSDDELIRILEGT